MAVRLDVEWGQGVARKEGLRALTSGAHVVTLDLEWHAHPGSAWYVSSRYGEVQHELDGRNSGFFIPPEVEENRFWSVTAGPQLSAPRPWNGPFVSAGTGVGWLDMDHGAFRTQWTRTVGFAWEIAFGFRLTPAPGPVGFAFTTRAHQVIARETSSFAATMGIGIVVRPGIARLDEASGSSP